MKKLLFVFLSITVFAILFTLIASAEVGEVMLETLGEREKPVLDGDISDEIWGSVPVFVTNENTCNTSWSYRSLVNGESEIKLLASDDGLYIAAEVYDYSLVLSSGANDVANSDDGYNHDDDLYGYNGDLFILALDPFGELEANESTRNGKGIWYTFTPYNDGTMRVFRSNPDFGDITSNVAAAYKQKDYGYDFEAFIPLSQITADYALFEGLPEHLSEEYFSNGARHTASILYMDRYVYGSFKTVYTADGNIIDYDAQLKEYSDFHQLMGTTYTVSRWGTTCDMIPRDNIEGRAGNGVAAKLHGIYLTVNTEHKCTPEVDAVIKKASCTNKGITYFRCSECQRVLTYTQRGFLHTVGEWSEIRPASCKFGIEGKFCTDCGRAIYQRMIPAEGEHADGARANPEWVEVWRNGDERFLYCTMCKSRVAADADTLPLLYSDIDSSAWYAASCAEMFNRNIMTGVSAKLFAPHTVITRAMFVQVLAKLAGAELKSDAESIFEDVDNGKWYTAAVCWAYENGITTGVDKAHFAPDKGVSREQIALFMMKYAALDGKSTESRADISGYTDKAQVSKWAQDAVSWAIAEKIISGTSKTTISPKNPATRAQVAQIVFSYIK